MTKSKKSFDNIVIRAAQATDIVELTSLIEAHAKFEKQSIDVLGLGERLAFAMQGDEPRLTVYVAQLNSALVAYCALVVEYSSWRAQNFVHMDCLYVNSTSRGVGVGAALFERAISFTKASGLSDIEWQSPSWNTRAQKFYESQGASYDLKTRYRLAVG